jgi:glycerophosphoryl diester phosphodiesterase
MHMQFFSHRGKGFGFPEGSLAAFEAALGSGSSIECDLRLLATGEVAVHHSARPDMSERGAVFRGAGNKLISEMTRAEFLSLRASGSDVRPPLLNELLVLFDKHPKTHALFELKAYDLSLLEQIISAVESHGLRERVMVIGSRGGLRGFAKGDTGLKHLKEHGIRVGALDAFPVALRKNIEALGVETTLTGWTTLREKLEFRFFAPWLLRIKQQVNDLHAHGHSIIFGVAQSQNDIDYFTDLGADGIVVDIVPRS